MQRSTTDDLFFSFFGDQPDTQALNYLNRMAEHGLSAAFNPLFHSIYLT